MEVNLISDTVTRPSSGMLKAMMQASVGDDVFKEDPTVNELEAEVARLFGKESALFFPSGTMANQTGIKIHTDPGDQLICDKYAHVYNYEGGGVSFNSGVSCRLIDGNRGMMTAGQVEKAINPPDFYHSPRTTLVCIENTTNKGGGACWDFKELQQIKSVCEKHQLKFHLDGARIWNALASKPERPEAYGALFDPLRVCLSPGMGCPVGSLLIGSEEAMEKALRIRKVLGGGMRQAGYLAAAGLYALENNRERLKEDHRRAREIGQALASRTFVKHVAPVETNIVIFELEPELASDTEMVTALNEKGIRLIGMGEGKLRLVTHLDYTEQMHEYVLATIGELEPVKG